MELVTLKAGSWLQVVEVQYNSFSGVTTLWLAGVIAERQYV